MHLLNICKRQIFRYDTKYNPNHISFPVILIRKWTSIMSTSFCEFSVTEQLLSANAASPKKLCYAMRYVKTQRMLTQTVLYFVYYIIKLYK